MAIPKYIEAIHQKGFFPRGNLVAQMIMEMENEA
jgi:hypothetical protein